MQNDQYALSNRLSNFFNTYSGRLNVLPFAKRLLLITETVQLTRLNLRALPYTNAWFTYV